MDPRERDAVIKSFKESKYIILVATNVLARGYDNRSINLVINLDLPIYPDNKNADMETYLHRVGRTGRFGDLGIALNIVHNEEDKKLLQQI